MFVRAAALAFLLFAGEASAQNRPASETFVYDQGLRSYLEGDHGAAWFTWLALATAGDAEAQFSMGHLYRVGEGVPSDARIAADWFTRAASQGHGQAMLNLALMHEQGAGVSRDPALAFVFADRAGRVLAGASLERARTAAARIALSFQPNDAERARRLMLEIERRQPLPARTPARP
jgi:TPR repeat protein